MISLRQLRDQDPAPEQVTTPERQAAAGELSEALAEITAVMDEMRIEMERLTDLMERQLELFDAKKKQKEERIAIEEAIVEFLLGRRSIPDIGENEN